MAEYTRIGSLYAERSLAGGVVPHPGGKTVQKRSYYLLKRGFDIVVSLLLLGFVLSWLAPLIALMIKLDSEGSVFFLQKRVGKNGRCFICYKFRTMVANEEADHLPAAKNDPRITRLGKWLRRYNIDELPQLINVLAGHMSIVGPRPHMPSDCNRFSALIPGYAYRHRAKPGITGMAQVKGFHGPAPDYESIFLRYHWDAFYVRHAGIWLDMQIILETAMQRVASHYIKKEPATEAGSCVNE